MKMTLRATCSLLLALMLALTMLVGCQGKTPAASPPESSTSPAAQPAPETVPQADLQPKVDRYQEVMDPSGDKGKLTVRFFQMKSGTDVKSGDSAIITFPDGKVMLVDASSPECAATVVQYLQDMGITKLDAILNSHPHIDHLGGIPWVLEKFPVDRIYRSKLTYTSATYEKYEDTIARKGIPVTYLAEGDEFDFGGAHFKIYNPEPEIVYPEDKDTNTQFINNNSIAMRITYGKSALFMAGDLYTPGEQRIVDKYGKEIQSDIAKMNHHGDKTSNARSYIDLLKPQVAVGMHDGLASLDVYNAYRKREVQTYLSSVDGCVKVQVDDENHVTVVTQYDRPANSMLK